MAGKGPTKTVDHEKLGLQFDLPDWDMKQGDVEAFYAALGAQGVGILAPVRNANIIRAAIKCGWLEGQLTDDELAEFHPAGTTWLAGEIDEIVAAAFVIPGE
jgi:hypothetical protein